MKVCDFGLSKSKELDTVKDAENSGIGGTWSYMAPEQLLHYEQPTTKTDVWSLACTFKELFSGRHMWPETSLVAVRRILRDNTPIDWTDTPVSVQKVLKPCFNYNPQNRPSIETLISDFERIFK